MHASEVDLVLAATITPQPGEPPLAVAIARRIEAERPAAVDVGAACSGFLSGLTMAAGAIEAGRAKHVVVVGGDLMSRMLDYDDQVTAGIFGDGAGAVVVRAIDGPSRMGPHVLGCDGSDAGAITANHPHACR
jgi:3-oxoacyl-[acyl-carrier-protein] synthase III